MDDDINELERRLKKEQIRKTAADARKAEVVADQAEGNVLPVASVQQMLSIFQRNMNAPLRDFPDILVKDVMHLFPSKNRKKAEMELRRSAELLCEKMNGVLTNPDSLIFTDEGEEEKNEK
jgi:hypothetical protein